MVIERRRACDPAFLEIFHSKSIPAHREIGMKILDSAVARAHESKIFRSALEKEELEHVLLLRLEK
jgi:hypothetical protein